VVAAGRDSLPVKAVCWIATPRAKLVKGQAKAVTMNEAMVRVANFKHHSIKRRRAVVATQRIVYHFVLKVNNRL
jgi:hypothetical protein